MVAWVIPQEPRLGLVLLTRSLPRGHYCPRRQKSAVQAVEVAVLVAGSLTTGKAAGGSRGGPTGPSSARDPERLITGRVWGSVWPPPGVLGVLHPVCGGPAGGAGLRCPSPAVLCFALTRSLLLTCLVPAGLLGLRYYYSRKVVLAYLDCALHTDMADIEQYYMKPPGESLGSAASSSPPLCPFCPLSSLLRQLGSLQHPQGRPGGGHPVVPAFWVTGLWERVGVQWAGKDKERQRQVLGAEARPPAWVWASVLLSLSVEC